MLLVAVAARRDRLPAEVHVLTPLPTPTTAGDAVSVAESAAFVREARARVPALPE